MLTATIDKTREWTVDDYSQLEEGLLAQLLDGELIMSPAPTPRHQRTVRNLYDILNGLKLNGELFFAPIDLYIDTRNILQPDLVFISDNSRNIVTERGIEGPPELIIEVVSPSNSYVDRNIKKRKYLEFGVREVWILDPGNKTLEIYTDSIDKPSLYLAGEGAVQSAIMDELSFELNDLFSK